MIIIRKNSYIELRFCILFFVATETREECIVLLSRSSYYPYREAIDFLCFRELLARGYLPEGKYSRKEEKDSNNDKNNFARRHMWKR